MESKASESYNGDDGSSLEDIGLQVGGVENKLEDELMKPKPTNQKNHAYGNNQAKLQRNSERLSPESESRSSSSNKRKQLDDRIESTKAEMDQVMEENQRLKTYLDRIIKDYKTLEVRYMDMVGQDALKKHKHDEEEPDELIVLSLGRTPTEKSKEDCRKTTTKNNDSNGDVREALKLGLDCKFDNPKKSPDPSRENSVEEVEEDLVGLEKLSKGAGERGDDESLQQNPIKRARVSVKIRCDTPTMNDGCQWRKYGQKIAKGNPCPRAYYRCTVSSSCPVRKQVQRCADDMSILITTYEGTHNHQLPMAATAMASTTSAAASMLISGSSTSSAGQNLSNAAAAAGLNGLNFYLSDSSRSKPFYIPNSSISTSPSYPTITIDLTSNSSASSSSSSQLSRMGNTTFAPPFSTTNLNFSTLDSSTLPLTWSDGMLSYGAHQPITKPPQNLDSSSMSFGHHSQETLFHSYLQKTMQSQRQQLLLPETVAAATKAITADPNFQSALAAALTLIIGSNGSASSLVQVPDNGIKASESFPILSSYPSSNSAGNKCSLSFLSKPPPPSAAPPAGVILVPPNLPASKSSFPNDNRDHTD